MASLQEPPSSPGLPQNVDAEAALLGALMIDNRLVDVIADKVQPFHFFEPLHARIYEAILREVALGRRATPVTLKTCFVDDPSIKEVGGVGYLGQLTGSGAAVIGARDFADQIRNLARLRALIGVGQFIAERAADMSEDVDVAGQIAHAQSEIDALSNENVDGLVEMSLGEALGMAADADDGEPGVLSGIEGLDRVLGPIKPKQLIIVAGRPGMGKSVLAESYGIGVVRARDTEPPEEPVPGVLFISAEMSAEELGQRAAADICFNGHSGINHSDIEGKRLSVEQARAVARASQRLKESPFIIVDQGGITPSRIGGIVRRWKRRLAAKGHPLKLVIVDYLQLLAPDRPRGKKYEEISDISMALKAIAKQQDVGMIAVAQLSRDVERRDNKRPTLADLRDSGQIEQDADGVVFLFRHEYYLRAVEPPESDEPKKAEERATWERAIEACQGHIEFIVAKRRGRPAPLTGHGRFYGAFQTVR